MLRLLSLLESRHRSLHLWASFEREKSSRRIHRWQLDILSISNYVIKKGRPHGNRHGKTEEQRKYSIAHNLRKRCIKKGFEGIHDRFQKDLRFRDSPLRIGRTEEVCIQMDEVAQKDFTYRMSSDEYMRYEKNWWISLNTSGQNAPMKLRSDFSDVLTKLHRLHRESGEERLAPIPFWQYEKLASVGFFTQHIMVAMERFLVELIKIHQSQAPLSS